MIHHSGASGSYSLQEEPGAYWKEKSLLGIPFLLGRCFNRSRALNDRDRCNERSVGQSGFEAAKLPANGLVASVRRKTHLISVAPKSPPLEAGHDGVVGAHRVASPQCSVSQAGGRALSS